MSFHDLGLSERVLAAITAAGYQTPTPIQKAAIPFALEGRDVLGIAQTGTGKTASFVLPMLCRLETGRARARMPRSLIIAPTRELAAQCADAFAIMGANHKLTVALLIGGVSFDEQERKLDRGADVLIATPGRLLDHFGRGKLLLTGVEILVIDEADRMLDMGFIPDIERICKLLPATRQTLFFSATMPGPIQSLVKQFLRDPERIEVAPPSTTARTITQKFIHAPFDAKARRKVLRDLIRAEDVKNAIIFCNRKTDVAILHKSLLKHGFNVGALHGDLDQHQRTATLDAFRAGKITLLAASDVAARGLDIPEVSHVFNFDVPRHAEDYVHRIGRTGRAGRSGTAATLVTKQDAKLIRAIEKLIKEEIRYTNTVADGAEPVGADVEAPQRSNPKARRAGARRRSGGSGARMEASDRKAAAPETHVRGENRHASAPSAPISRPASAPKSASAQADSGRAGGQRGPNRVKAGGSAHRARSAPPARPIANPFAEPEPTDRSRRPAAEAADPRSGRTEPAGTERKRGPNPAHRQDDLGPSPQGLGEHVPAFLMRPVRLRSTS